MSTFRLEALLQHPMYGVTCEQVYTSGASVFAVASGGERVFVSAAARSATHTTATPPIFRCCFASRSTTENRRRLW